ncbi:MAG: hypothetical protein WDW38_002264 [Sanguina aurantia]
MRRFSHSLLQSLIPRRAPGGFAERSLEQSLRTAAFACGLWKNFASLGSLSQPKHRIVFLGTPTDAAHVLQDLVQASQAPESNFEVCCIITRPQTPKYSFPGQSVRKGPTSPVELLAHQLGLGHTLMSPATAKEEGFLATLRGMQPDLCVTAAYGGMLPQRFLDIPTKGTVNIHPSLLPLYRGAAPVQRAVQEGKQTVGVSLVYTVLKCDAGPVIDQQRVVTDNDIHAPELTRQLFKLGSVMLLKELPNILSGAARQTARTQSEAAATHTAKLTRQESYLDVSKEAFTLHNQVRAFAGWPGTRVTLELEDKSTGARDSLE